jgi:hypothetical protein
MDLKGVSIFKLFGGKVRAFSKLSSQITQDYYPEIMGKLFILNSGYLFSGIWAIIKGWLDPVTRKKIQIISGSGKKELLKLIDAENLPEDLGGTYTGDIRDN